MLALKKCVIIIIGSDKMRLTKKYYFSRTKDIKQLPKYVDDYVFEDENIWIVYTTLRDHGVFTNKKIILFNNQIGLRQRKEIIIIPYEKITTASIVFYDNHADLKIVLDNQSKVCLKFIRIIPIDKMKLRYLYTCISRIINHQVISKEDVNKLIENNFKISE